jgi:hypothetical protein
MLLLWNNVCLSIGDVLFGWSLRLPSDATLFAISAISAVILILARRLTTNQDLLRRVASDKKTLKQLIRRAKKEADRDTLQRQRKTLSTVSLLAFRSEWLPLLVSILPIAVLATWCIFRLGYHPPRAGEAVDLMVYAPVSAAGTVAHVVPEAGVRSDGWIRQLQPVTDDGPPYSSARWTLRADGDSAPYRLTLRIGGKNYTREFLVGQRIYSSPVVYHDDDVVTELQMKPLKLFGIVPGMDAIGFPPWLVAYLIIVLPLVPLLKRVFRVY